MINVNVDFNFLRHPLSHIGSVVSKSLFEKLMIIRTKRCVSEVFTSPDNKSSPTFYEGF